MLYLFSTKAALRKAMVGLANNAVAYAPQEATRIANYLADGGFDRMDAKIKAQEEIVKSLERQSAILTEMLRRKEEQSKSLAEEIKAQQSLGMKEMQERIALQAEIQGKQAELSGLRDDIATAQGQLDSLVAQIGAAEREAPGPDATIEEFRAWVKGIPVSQ